MKEDVGKELKAAVEVLREGGGIDASLLLGGCSMKWAMPSSLPCSWREPTPMYTPAWVTMESV